MLECPETPFPPSDPSATQRDVADWALDLFLAALDCRAALHAVRDVVEVE